MSIKIYWGPAGSYKTSSAVWNDLPDFAFDGRTVVTNIRGLTNRDKIVEILEREFKKKKVPDSFELIHQESETKEGKEKWLKWFHWMPNGAGILVDEGQRIWPKKMTAKEIKSLDYPGGADAATKDSRPENFDVSFDMHRHQNWDLVITTTNIRRLHENLRQNADSALRHRNRALDGLKGSFNRLYHHPENEGRTEGDREGDDIGLKIPKWVFELYESTKTGIVTDTRNGKPWWKDGKIRFLLFISFFLICLQFYMLPRLYNRYYGDKGDSTDSQTIETIESDLSEKEPENNPVNLNISGFDKVDINYVGKIKYYDSEEILFSIKTVNEISGTVVTSSFFKGLGYKVYRLGDIVILDNDITKIYVKREGIQGGQKII